MYKTTDAGTTWNITGLMKITEKEYKIIKL